MQHRASGGVGMPQGQAAVAPSQLSLPEVTLTSPCVPRASSALCRLLQVGLGGGGCLLPAPLLWVLCCLPSSAPSDHRVLARGVISGLGPLCPSTQTFSGVSFRGCPHPCCGSPVLTPVLSSSVTMGLSPGSSWSLGVPWRPQPQRPTFSLAPGSVLSPGEAALDKLKY